MTRNPSLGNAAQGDACVRPRKFGNSLTLLLVLFIAITAAVASAMVNAQPATTPAADKFPDIDLPERANGEAAIAALGSRLPAVAASYGKTTAEFARLLRSDLSLWIDRRGRAFYIEPAAQGDAAAEADATATADLHDGNQYPLSETFNLQSKADAPRTIYLDFNGHVTTGTAWNASNNVPTINSPAYDRDGDPSTFNDSELRDIQRMWRQVAEDFAPFDVNVTTADPGQDAISRDGSSDPYYGTRVVITRDNFAGCSCGGFAYLTAFNDTTDYYKPAFVFNGGVKGAGEAITHEVGHNLGLSHDGVTGGTAYYRGHGSGETGWAPIMGVGYYQNLVQWSAGEYAGANNQEDDLARMQTYGAPLLGDDHGDSINQASDVASSSDGSTATLSARGRIGTRSDRDLFRFFAGSGTFSISAEPVPDAPNLDLLLTVLDSTGTPVASNNPESALAGVISGTLAAGEYFLEVSGVGKGDVLGTGYSDYASLGYYQVSGSVADSSGLAPPVAAASAPSYVPGFSPQYVGFDGSGSQDAVQWDWDFGDGSGASGVTVNHSYSAPGDYTVTLTVISETGLSDSDSLTITVDNRDPLAAFSATPGSGTAPVTVEFDASASSDEDSISDPTHGIVDYQWDFGDGSVASGASVQHEYVTGGPFTVTLSVTDTLGASGGTAQELDISPPPYSDHVASGEANSAGTVTGTYLATHDSDGVLQTIRERESGGRKRSRYSYLEHRWYFNLPAGDSAMLYLSGFRESSADGDDMAFSYQLGNGEESALPIALGTESGTQLASLPATGGDLTLIVRDTDRRAGSRDLDAVFIDQLYVQVSNGNGDSGGSESPPAAPTNLAASADSASASLSWTDNASDETGFTIYRAAAGGPRELLSSIGANETAFTDSGLSPSTQYRYEVVAFNAAGESAATGVDVTTDGLSGIVLSGSGSKVKGVQTVNLSWTGVDSGELWRDGVSQGNVSGGSYQETLGKGGGSYTYLLCDNGVCSDPVVIVF